VCSIANEVYGGGGGGEVQTLGMQQNKKPLSQTSLMKLWKKGFEEEEEEEQDLDLGESFFFLFRR